MKELERGLKRAAAVFLAVPLLFSGLFGGISAEASYVDTNKNTFVHDAEELQVGYAGQDMQFKVRVGYNKVNGMYIPKTDEITDVIVRLSNDQSYLAKDTDPGQSSKNPYNEDDPNEVEQHDAWNEGKKAGLERAYKGNLTYPIDSGNYPFEVNASVFTQETRFDVLKVNEYHEITFNVSVRADTEEGYYGIPVSFYYNEPPQKYADYKTPMKVEFVNVYIKKATDIKNPANATADKSFAVGEGQATPNGTVPGIMEFGVNFRNQRNTKLYDVNIHMNMALAKDTEMQKTGLAKASATTGFPFDISDSNYDRHFDEVDSGGTITAPYSMSIMANAASGYYPLSYEVSYKLTPNAATSYTEGYAYYVRISNPSMTETDSDSLGDFNANDRTKARLVVDSFRTIPEQVYAGQEFELVLVMKNASSNIAASNILFTLESEKVDNSAVFSSESGANSIAVNALAAGASTELSLHMTAAPGVDPRSYSITVNEKYDSPEFKNAEEKVTVDIPVNQVARLSASNFELMPEAINVGDETNVMFGINNTGKVTLYNVEAFFSADSIKPVSAYVGNIKPGETGNVDTMLTGIAPTADDGTVKVTIRYEDVNGSPSETEQSINLMVSEAMDDDMDMGDFDINPEPEEPSKIARYKLPLGGAAVLVLLALILIRRRRKKKENESADDETI